MVTIGTHGLHTASNPATFTTTTHFFHLFPTSVTGTNSRRIWTSQGSLYENYIDIHNETIRIRNGGFNIGGVTVGVWTVPLTTANTDYLVAISHEWGNDVSNPVVYINGVSQTVSEFSTPDKTGTISGSWHLGSDSSDTNRFAGAIAECAVWNTQLSTAKLQRLTASKVKRYALQLNPTHYYPLDDLSSGETV